MTVARRPTTRPSASIRIHFFTTSAGFCEKVVILSAFGSDLHQGRRFLLLGLAARRLPAANNKTAAFAGRCFVWAYRGGAGARQGGRKVHRPIKPNINNGLD